jgi:RHS repeat-associated protein
MGRVGPYDRSDHAQTPILPLRRIFASKITSHEHGLFTLPLVCLNRTRPSTSAATATPLADQTDRVQVNADTFVYTGLGLSARSDTSGTTHFVRCSCGLLNDERTPDGKKYYYLFDGLGSIVGLTNSSSTEVNSYDYDPYGQVSNLTEQSGLNNPFKFAGGYLDSNASLGSNLYKFGTRYYDPSIGRWTQLDPVGGSLGDLNAANRYTYANDDPVNVVDPSGKDCLTTFLSDLATVGFFIQLAGLGLNAIGLLLEANPPVGIVVLFLYVAYVFPILVGIAIALYNNAAQACGWSPIT